MDTVASCAVRLLLQMVGVSRETDPPRFAEMTEGRGVADPGYGWCGDAVTYALMLAGCRDGNVLNRAELNGSWTPGDNLDRIIRYAKRAGTWHDPQVRPVQYAVYFKKRRDGGHVGMVTSVNASSFDTVDGNSQFGKVATNRREWSIDGYYGWAAPETFLFTPGVMPANMIILGEPDPVSGVRESKGGFDEYV